MTKALVVTHRDPVLPAVLKALAGGDLAIVAVPGAESARQHASRSRPDLLVLDLCSLPTEEHPAQRALAAELHDAALIAVVGAEQPRRLRLAVELQCDALLLDPFDLDTAAAALSRILRRRASPAGDSDPLEGLSNFLKGLAHEILNPLFPITAFLQILQRDPALSAELRERYDKMLEGTRRIEKTVRDLECFARVRKPQRSLLDLAEFLRECAARWRGQEQALDATVEAPATTPRVLADREQLAVAFHHLVAFASGGERRSPVEATLRVNATRLDLSILGHVAVKLPPRPADALLPYHDNQGAGRPGTLELAVAWGILRSHRATLDVEAAPSDAVRFTVSFPVAPLARERAES
jgi:DNA-binding NarL/FixJ family response regulator